MRSVNDIVNAKCPKCGKTMEDNINTKREKLLLGAKQYVEKHFVAEKQMFCCQDCCLAPSILGAPSTLADDLLSEEFLTGQTFSQKLLALVSATGEKDAEVYKRANIDRRLYSKIISNANYSPSKNTVLAFAFALKLSLKDSLDLLDRAGFTLSHSVRRDLIIEYLIKKKVYDLLFVNEILSDMGEAIIAGKNVA